MSRHRPALDANKSLFRASTVLGVQEALGRGAQVNHVSEKGATALSNAVRKGRIEVVDALLSAGAAVDIVDHHGIPMCLHAARSGNVQVMARMLEAGMDLHGRDAKGNTALMVANAGAMASYLLEAGQEMEARNHQGMTPLHCLVAESRFTLPAGFGVLVDRGADINARDATGRSPAMLCNHPDMLRRLLDQGADASLVDGSGQTLLHHLARMLSTFLYNDARPLVERLLQDGCDPHAVDATGRSALDVFSTPHARPAASLGGVDGLAQLVASVQAAKLCGKTPRPGRTSSRRL